MTAPTPTSTDSLASVARELSKLLEPLRTELDPSRAKIFFLKLGLTLTDAQIASLATPINTIVTRSDELIALIPVILDGSSVDKVRHLSEGQRRGLRRGYLKKLRDPRAWARLLRLRTDFRVLAAAMGLRPRRTAPAASAAPPDNANPLFAEAFDAFATGGRDLLLVFSESDRLWWEWREKFESRRPELVSRHAARCRVHVVAGANHVFTFPEWQRDMLAKPSAAHASGNFANLGTSRTPKAAV